MKKIKWSVWESHYETVDGWDAFCVTKEEAVVEWEACYGRKFSETFGRVTNEVDHPDMVKYWRQGKRHIGTYYRYY